MGSVAIAIGTTGNLSVYRRTKLVLGLQDSASASDIVTVDALCDLLNVSRDATYEIDGRQGQIGKVWITEPSDLEVYRAAVLAVKLQLDNIPLLAYHISATGHEKLRRLIQELSVIYRNHEQNSLILSPYTTDHSGQIAMRRLGDDDHARYQIQTQKVRSRLQSLSAETASVLRTISLFS
jgi:hypothetical protein